MLASNCDIGCRQLQKSHINVHAPHLGVAGGRSGCSAVIAVKLCATPAAVLLYFCNPVCGYASLIIKQ
jgi:hypothetical protein